MFLKGFESMKHLLSKTPTYIVVAVIIVLTVSLTLIAAAVTNTLANNEINSFGELLQALVDGQTGNDINGDGNFNILDIIASKYESGWTTGIY